MGSPVSPSPCNPKMFSQVFPTFGSDTESASRPLINFGDYDNNNLDGLMLSMRCVQCLKNKSYEFGEKKSLISLLSVLKPK
jgi:hypothetical protein